MHLMLCLGGLPPLSLDLGPARGVGVPLGSRLVRTPASPSPSGAGEVGAARLQQTPTSRASASVVSPHSSPHVQRREESRETSESRPRVLSSLVPDLRIEEHGRIREPGHERVAPVDVAVVLALSPLPVRGQEVESVDAGHRPGRSLLVPAHAVTGRGLLTATGRGVEALGRGVTGLDPRIDTGLPVTGRGLLTATSRAVSERVPLPAGEIGVTARGHTLSRPLAVTRATTWLLCPLAG